MRLTRDLAMWLVRAERQSPLWMLTTASTNRPVSRGMPQALRDAGYVEPTKIRAMSLGAKNGWLRIWAITDKGRAALEKAKSRFPNLDHPAKCADCGRLHGDYMVIPKVWRKLVPPSFRKYHICIRCLDARSHDKRGVGLSYHDISDAQVNDTLRWRLL